MPITVTAPRGTFTAAGRREILPRLTAELAESFGFTGRPELVRTIGGTVHDIDPDDIYAGGEPAPLVLVELKLPDVALPTLEDRADFIARATAAVRDLTGPSHRDADTWVNIVHAPDGAWGIGGQALTNAALTAAAA